MVRFYLFKFTESQKKKIIRELSALKGIEDQKIQKFINVAEVRCHRFKTIGNDAVLKRDKAKNKILPALKKALEYLEELTASNGPLLFIPKDISKFDDPKVNIIEAIEPDYYLPMIENKVFDPTINFRNETKITIKSMNKTIRTLEKYVVESKKKRGRPKSLSGIFLCKMAKDFYSCLGIEPKSTRGKAFYNISILLLNAVGIKTSGPEDSIEDAVRYLKQTIKE